MVETALRSGRRMGWSDNEANLLWETADEAQQQGLPLKSVFEQIARQTGRRPNSIRNYYYAQVQKRMGDQPRPARFVPFQPNEVDELVEHVLRERAQGHSVRSCLQRLANDDHSLMLRYQNKYRSVIKSRPDLVERIVEKLRNEGVDVHAPEVNHRPRVTLSEACQNLNEGARLADDPALVHACETLTRLIREKRPGPAADGDPQVKMDLIRMALEDKQKSFDQFQESAQALVTTIKEFLGQSEQTRLVHLSAFCASISERIGLLEQRLEELRPE